MEKNPLHRLFEGGTLQTYAPGEMIARAEDNPKMIYLINTGAVRIYSISGRGEEYLHIAEKPGELFPVVTLIDKEEQNVYYEALDTVTAYSMLTEEFKKKVQQDAELSFCLAMQVTDQFTVYTDRVDNLQYKFGRERLVYRILFLASRFGRKTDKGTIVDVPLTQKVLGSSINLSRETVARELRRLEDRGLVVYDDRRIVLLNIEQLTHELKDPINPTFWGLTD